MITRTKNPPCPPLPGEGPFGSPRSPLEALTKLLKELDLQRPVFPEEEAARSLSGRNSEPSGCIAKSCAPFGFCTSWIAAQPEGDRARGTRSAQGH